MKSKILTAIMSVAIAFGLWLYVVTVISPGYENTYYNIPVVVQNESLLLERGLMITGNENPTINLHLSGNRIDLNKLNSTNITLLVDASKIYESGKHSLSYDIIYPGDVPNDVVSVKSRSSSFITLNVEERISKPVDVYVEYTGQVADGFICDMENATLSTKVINVTGPKSVVDQITQARIQVDLQDQSKPINQSYAYLLCDENGQTVQSDTIVTDVQAVNLGLRIQRVKTIPLEFTIVDGGGATKDTVSISIRTESGEPITAIQVSGSDEKLENLTKLEIGTLDLSEQLPVTGLLYVLKLPEGVINESGITKVVVDIQFPTLSTKTVSVTNIIAVNVPAGMNAELGTKVLEVDLRGPADQIDAITDADVSLTVDFNNAPEGITSRKANVVINGAYPNVGALHSYNVTATLRPAS